MRLFAHIYSAECNNTYNDTLYRRYAKDFVFRGNKGFVALGDMDKEYYTGLPDGEYCDLISECAQKVQVEKILTLRNHWNVELWEVSNTVEWITEMSNCGGGEGSNRTYAISMEDFWDQFNLLGIPSV